MSTAATPRPSRTGLVVVLLVVLLAVAVVAAGLVWWRGGVGTIVGRERCVAAAHGDSVELDLEQAQNAATIAAAAARRNLPSRALVVGLATAIQESKLLNLYGGDHDSAGLFQQRPSQGWGSQEQVTNPAYASGRFFDSLVQIDGWQTLAITEAAQAVQRSAFPDAYQDHAQDARVLASTFSGSSGAALSCTVRAQQVAAETETASGLTPRAQRLRRSMESAFGTLSLGGFAPGGVTRANPSAHNDGRAIDVFFRPYQDRDQRRHGWRLAHWLVAHADSLDVSILIYRDHIWSARRSPEGWREYVSPFGDPKDPVQRHLDHIHVEVL